MRLRRDVSRKLLQAFTTEPLFMATVVAEAEAGRMKKDEVKRTITWYYQQNERLLRDLTSVVENN